MSVRYCQDKHPVLKITVHNAEGELVEDVAATVGEVIWPALGSFPDSRYSPLKRGFEIQRGSEASLFIPGK